MGLRRKSVDVETEEEIFKRLNEAITRLGEQVKVLEEAVNKSNRKMTSLLQELNKASERMREQNRGYGPRGSRVWR